MKLELRSIAALAAIIIIVGSAGSALILFDQEEPKEDYKIFTTQVADENDDGRSFTADGSEKGYEDEIAAWALLQLAPSYSFGVRFVDVEIPKNATILEAYIELYSVSTPGNNLMNCKIYCDNVDDAVNFSVKGVLNISGRNYSKNYADWNESVGFNKWEKTPELKNLVQEIVNRKNWTKGNSMAFLFITKGLYGYAGAFTNYLEGLQPVKLFIKWKEI